MQGACSYIVHSTRISYGLMTNKIKPDCGGIKKSPVSMMRGDSRGQIPEKGFYIICQYFSRDVIGHMTTARAQQVTS